MKRDLRKRGVKAMMKFVNDQHEQFFEAHTAASDAQEKKALVYVIGIDDECRNHFEHLYDTKLNCIRPEGLREGWQTGASIRITRLAFNLFTWQTVEGDDPEKYAPIELFSNLDTAHRQGVLLALAYFA